MLKKLLIAVFCIFLVTGVITDVSLLCHSSCGTCPSYPRIPNGCSTCSSVFLNYLSIGAGQAPTFCIPDPNYPSNLNAQLFYTIDGNSMIGDANLWGYTFNNLTINTPQTLNFLGVYSSDNFVSLFTSSSP